MSWRGGEGEHQKQRVEEDEGMSMGVEGTLKIVDQGIP